MVFLGCLHRCSAVRRVHLLAILLGKVHIVTWITRRDNRTFATITCIGKNKGCLVRFQFNWTFNKTTKRPKWTCKFYSNRFQNRLLSHVITLPPNEVVQVLQAIAGTPTGGAMACRFLQAKWYDLEAKIGAGSVNFAKVISAITQYGATKFDYDEVSWIISRNFINSLNSILLFFCQICSWSHWCIDLVMVLVCEHWIWH